MTSIAVVVPSFRRPLELARCLDAVDRQVPSSDEVIVALRPDDSESRRIARHLGARVVAVHEPGHLPPLAAALAVCDADVIAVLDDDAVPRPGWLAGIAAAFTDPSVVACGGAVAESGRCVSRLALWSTKRRTIRRRGRTWYRGLGGLPPANVLAAGRRYEVDHLSGGNIAFRRRLLQMVGIDTALNRGAAVNYEADLCLGIKRSGRVLFDPTIVVDHLPAARRGAPAREDYLKYVAVYTHNLWYVAGKHMSPRERFVLGAYMLLVGQGVSPGLLRVVLQARKRRVEVWRLAKVVHAERQLGLHHGLWSARASHLTR